MVKIRLKRMGAKKRPVYRLVVADARSPRDGRFIDEIGFYDPLRHPAEVRIDADKVRDWMRRGARPSDTARRLLEQQGILQRTRHFAESAAKPAAEAPGAPTGMVTEEPEDAAVSAEAAAGDEPEAAVELAEEEERAEAAEEEEA